MKCKNLVTKFSQAHWLFVIVALVFGVFFVYLTPPLWGLDEPSHFARAYQLSNGELLPHTGKGNTGDLMPNSFINLVDYRTYDILDVIHSGDIFHRQDVTDKAMYDKLGSAVFTKNQSSFPSVATYSPVAYPGAVIGIAISNMLGLDVSQTLLMARFFSLFVYVALAAFAIWLMRGKKLAWLFFTVALIPTAIFQASTVTADNILIGLVLLFFALFCRIILDNSKNKKLLYSLALVAMLLPLVKVNYVFISLAFLLVPNNFFASKRLALIYKTVTLVIMVVTSVAWTQITKVTSASTISQRPDHILIVPTDQISFILHNPFGFIFASLKSIILYGDTYYQQLLFTISGNTVVIPIILTVILSFILVFLALYARSELLNMRKQIIFLGIGAIISISTIFAALYVAFTPTGWFFVDGIQGRYFTPLLIPLIILIAIALPVTTRISKTNLRVIVSVVIVACLGISILYNYVAFY
jgi:uncharacterized membrane protein